MIDYVVGFLFSTAQEEVVLIQKNRPSWQAGQLNGPGGKVEDGELVTQAMRREFAEETGVDIDWWEMYHEYQFPKGSVSFFVASHDTEVVSMTDETVYWYALDQLDNLPLIPNLRWAIPMALYALRSPSFASTSWEDMQ